MVERTISRVFRFACAALAVAVAGLLVAAPATAEAPLKPTGFAIRKAPNGLSYTLLHDMASTPSSKTALAIRDADVSKRLVFTFPNGASCATFRAFLTAGFARSGQTSRADQERSRTLGQACSRASIEPRHRAVIYYNAATKTTRLWVEKMGTVRLDGIDSMRAVWSLWFASPEDVKVRDSLLSRL